MEEGNATRTVEGIHNCIYIQERGKYQYNYRVISHLLTSYKILSNIILGRLTPYVHLFPKLGTINVVLDVTDRLMTTYFVLDTYWRKNGSIMTQYINYL